MITFALLMIRLAVPYTYADLPTENSVMYDGYYLCYRDESDE